MPSATWRVRGAYLLAVVAALIIASWLKHNAQSALTIVDSDGDVGEYSWLNSLEKRVAALSLNERDIVDAYLPEDREPPGLHDFLSTDYFADALKDETGKGLCVVTVVDGDYVAMVPPLVQSVAESHPDAKTIVFTLDATTSMWVKARKSIDAGFAVPASKYEILERPAWRNYPHKVGSSSVFAMVRFFNFGPELEKYGCKFTYLIDADSYVFKSSNVRFETILKWHAKRIAETRLPFDNIVRPASDNFGCPDEFARRLTGLHFVVNEPWYKFVGPCLDIIRRLAEAPNDAGAWCSAKSWGAYLDEHALWVAARLCAVGPGPRVSKPYDDKRPIHGIHVHHRSFADDVDKRYWCRRVPGMMSELFGMAVGRYKQMTDKAKCGEVLPPMPTEPTLTTETWLSSLEKRVAALSLNERDIVDAYLPEDREPPGLHDFLSTDYFADALKDETGKGLCVVTVVDGDYVAMVPPLVQSVAESHPDAKTIVFTLDATTSMWVKARKSIDAGFAVPASKYEILERPAWRNYPHKVGSSSVFAMVRFFNFGPELEKYGCKFTYLIDADSYVFKSSNVRFETILKWHAKRIAETRLPFDNIVRPASDNFGCPDEFARRLTGLHFVVNEPWYKFVGPCLDIIRRLAEAPNDAGAWCSAKSWGAYLDEHALWVAARLCAVGPGPRVSKPYDDKRPIHGIHVHHRSFADDVDKRYWCRRVPGMMSELFGMAVGRYKQMTDKAKCGEVLPPMPTEPTLTTETWLSSLEKRVAALSLNERDIVDAYLPEDREPPGLHDFLSTDYFADALKDETGKGLCVVTVVDGDYVAMVPPLVQSVAESHPDAKTIVFTLDATTSMWVKARKSIDAGFAVPASKYEILERPAWRNYPHKVGSSSVFAMVRFFNFGPELEKYGCKFTYLIDADSYVFKSSNVRFETILKWHAKRIAETRLPFDNIVRPASDNFGCPDEFARRLTGLHFVVNEPWYKFVGPCLDIIRRLAEAPNDAGAWCSAKSWGAYLDEHALWVAARLCAVGPGPRVSKPYDDKRPIHGIHVHHRSFADDVDKRYWCRRVPGMMSELFGMAVGRYKQMTDKAECSALRNSTVPLLKSNP